MYEQVISFKFFTDNTTFFSLLFIKTYDLTEGMSLDNKKNENGYGNVTRNYRYSNSLIRKIQNWSRSFEK